MERINEAALRALTEWAEGKQPPRRTNGICGNLNGVFHNVGMMPQDGYSYCEVIFEQMGLDNNLPLGHRLQELYPPWDTPLQVRVTDPARWVKWGEGREEITRRDLCALMARWIVETDRSK